MIASIKHLIFSEPSAVNHAMIHHGMIIYIANTARAGGRLERERQAVVPERVARAAAFVGRVP